MIAGGLAAVGVAIAGLSIAFAMPKLAIVGLAFSLSAYLLGAMDDDDD